MFHDLVPTGQDKFSLVRSFPRLALKAIKYLVVSIIFPNFEQLNIKRIKTMIEYLASNLWLVWTVVMLVCLILEVSSGDFFITCFAIGALVTIFPALLGVPLWAQILVWAVCSVLSIKLVRPCLLRLLHKGGEHRLSNADALIGQVGKVSQAIPAQGAGRVQLDGDDWKAVSTGEALPVGTKVRIVSRESIILTVEKDS